MRAFSFIVLAGMVLYGQAGQTVEAPKRTIFDSKGQDARKAPVPEISRPAGGAGAPESGRGASYRALDALSSSSEDMNAIRDGNVRRLTKDGCAPEVSARIADLRRRLQAAGVVPDAVERSARTNREESAPDSSNSATSLAVVSNWFQATGEGKAPAAKDKSMDLLDSVLPAAAGKSANDAQEARQSVDVANLKTELEHLYAACPGGRR